jgi:hypothetical protein
MSVSVVHRYFNEALHDHFYTTNAGEIGTTTVGAVGNHGYKYEGVSFSVFNHHHAGLVPVYRYYQEASHDHFYTANAGEIGATDVGQVGNHGYKCEGVLGYVSASEFPGSVAILRYFHEAQKNHFYTASPQEIGTTNVGAVGNHGYKFEGVVGYAYPAQHDLAPVHRYWNAPKTDHLYTTNAGEIGTTTPGQAGNHGYVSEGIAFHVFTHHHAGLVPVYRYWNEAKGDHFYTHNVSEIGTTHPGQAGNAGYVCEGVLGYVSATPFHGGVPVYRYNKDDTDHFYTSNAGEIGKTNPGEVGNGGYRSEGIMGYVPHA